MEIRTKPWLHLGKDVVLVGVAENAKMGAVVVLEDGSAVFIMGLDYWDDKLYKKKIKVTGALRREKLAPDPVVSASGEVSAGAFGESIVVEGARWEEV